MNNLNATILITGGTGLVGYALRQQLSNSGYKNIISASSKDCNLLDLNETMAFFKEKKPDYVFHTAAQVYGILGNMENKGLAFYNNVLINTHVIEAARLAGTKKIIAMGTGAVYPYPPVKLPLAVEDIWFGVPHGAEIGYAHAKRNMLAHLEVYRESYGIDYAYAISANIYGPNDHYDLIGGHVVPSLIRKFYDASQNDGRVSVWGNGSAKRDFVHSLDLADALIIMMNKISGPINIGSGEVHSIKEVVNHLAEYTGLNNKVDWDASKPNGQEYREYDLTHIMSSGFKPNFNLERGLKDAFDWLANNYVIARKSG